MRDIIKGACSVPVNLEEFSKLNMKELTFKKHLKICKKHVILKDKKIRKTKEKVKLPT